MLILQNADVRNHSRIDEGIRANYSRFENRVGRCFGFAMRGNDRCSHALTERTAALNTRMRTHECNDKAFCRHFLLSLTGTSI